MPSPARRRSIDVLIFVEHIVRELETACLLKHYLETDYDLSVQIASLQHDCIPLLSEVAAKVVCVPTCRSTADLPVLHWWDGVRIVNLAWEQILSNLNQQAQAPKERYLLHKVLHFAWGKTYDRYLQSCGVEEPCIRRVGSPNYSLLTAKYKFLSRGRRQLSAQFGLDIASKWVFIPENFGWAFMNDEEIHSRVRTGRYTMNQAFEYREYHRRTLNHFVEWLRKARKLKNVQFIVRPRPSTNVAEFALVFGSAIPESVTVTQDGTAREWLQASDVVMSNYSTVMVDAAVAGKPVFNTLTEPLPEFLQSDFLRLAPRITSADEFLEACDCNPDDLTPAVELREYALREFHVPEVDTFQYMASSIADIVSQSRRAPRCLYGRGWYRSDTSWRRFIPFQLRLALSRLVRGTPHPLTQYPEWRCRSTHSTDWLDPHRLVELEGCIGKEL